MARAVAEPRDAATRYALLRARRDTMHAIRALRAIVADDARHAPCRLIRHAMKIIINDARCHAMPRAIRFTPYAIYVDDAAR